jgi:acyl-CoA synthetase (AMP-forming)/AMP-acid ligase II
MIVYKESSSPVRPPRMSDPTKTFAILDAVARIRPDATAIVHQANSLSYRELLRAAASLAAGLENVGLTAKGVIGLVGSKNIEFVIVFMALLRRGNPVLILSPSLRPADIVETAEQLSLAALCYGEKLSGALKRGGAADVFELPSCPGTSAMAMMKFPGCFDLDPRQKELARREISSIRLSSGTTGQAKGIMLSEKAMWWRAQRTSAMHDVSADDCILYIVAMDLASPHLIAYFSKGAKVIVEEAHDFDAIRRLSSRHRITHIHATPLFYQMMTTHPELSLRDFSAIKYFISTGAPLPTAVAALFHRKFGREISQYYGLGECGPVFVNVSNDSSKRGAAGVLLPDWEISFAGTIGSAGSEAGELQVRGPGLFDGYYEPWRLADEILVDGWFRTGDVVRRDSDGYYWIVGRSKNLINVGGAKVFPWEIEDILMTHAGVEAALVYGASDGRFGEVPHAKVKRRGDVFISARELLRYANERLPILKNLRKIEFVSELARTTTGKVKRWD